MENSYRFRSLAGLSNFYFCDMQPLREPTALSSSSVESPGWATLKDIFYSCDVFEGAEKTHSGNPESRDTLWNVGVA